MRHDFIDRYSRLGSPVHRLPTSIKLAGGLALVLLVVAVSPVHWWLFAGVAVVLVCVAAVSRIPPRFLLGRLLILEPFALGAALLSLLQPQGGALFLALMTRSTLCLAAVILLSNTTPFAELLTLMKRLHMPALLVTTLALMYRYLFVLIDEAERMHRARLSRTLVRGKRRRWKVLVSLLAQLGIRSVERSERIYGAMQARGWR